MALSYPNTSGNELNEEIAKSHFISALGDRNLEFKVREREPKDLDAAFTIAVQLEAYQNAYCNQEPMEGRPNKGRYHDGLAGRITAIERSLKNRAPVEQQLEDLRQTWNQEGAERDKLSRELGRMHLLEEQRRASTAAVVANPRHVVPVDAPVASGMTSERRKNVVKCYRCKGLGHYARDC